MRIISYLVIGSAVVFAGACSDAATIGHGDVPDSDAGSLTTDGGSQLIVDGSITQDRDAGSDSGEPLGVTAETIASGLTQGWALSLDPNNGYIYWTDLGSSTTNAASHGTVSRRAVAGGAIEVLAVDQDHPVAIMALGGDTVWLNQGHLVGTTVPYGLAGGAVMKASGTTGVALVTGQEQPTKLAAYAGNLYWIDVSSGQTTGTQAGLWRSGIDGSNPTHLNTVSGNGARHFFVGASETLYSGLAAVIKYDGTQTAPADTENGVGWDLIGDSSGVFYTTLNSHLVRSLASGSSTPVDIGTGNGAIAQYGTSLYWVDCSAVSVKPCAIRSRAKAGGAVATVISGEDAIEDLAVSGGYVYWTTATKVQRGKL